MEDNKKQFSDVKIMLAIVMFFQVVLIVGSLIIAMLAGSIYQKPADDRPCLKKITTTCYDDKYQHTDVECYEINY